MAREQSLEEKIARYFEKGQELVPVYLLDESGYLDKDLAEKMVKAVGFRNLIVRHYSKIEMKRVFGIAQEDIHDLHD